jgi:hypothetical protein
MVDGVPWVVPPRWISPTGNPIRIRIADARAGVRRLGEQLRLPADGPDHPPPDG